MEEEKSVAASPKTEKNEDQDLVESIEKMTLVHIEKADQKTKSPLLRKSGLVYDENMQKHLNMWEKDHPECPQRIERIFERLCNSGLVQRCERIPSRPATLKELIPVHSENYVKELQSCSEKSPRELYKRGEEFDSIYLSYHVYECAALSAGCTLELLDALLTNKIQNGFAVVRPPGHHALPDAAMGFSYFNNVSLAAYHAKRKYGLSRILIIDWDIHWGNGTQKIFEEDPNVLYVSLHRYDNMDFWPHLKEANYTEVGKGKGEGKTIHIPWNKKGMGDSEYLAAFMMLILPVAYEFRPDLVLVSCGFDSGRGDPKGLCCVTPEGFAQMTHLLMGLANGKVLLILEGGYNLSTISYSAEECFKVLLGDSCPQVEVTGANESAMQSILNAARTHSKYWECLKWAANVSLEEDQAEEIESRIKEMKVKEEEKNLKG